jgi:uncharacterized protein (TIGR02231 family)
MQRSAIGIGLAFLFFSGIPAAEAPPAPAVEAAPDAAPERPAITLPIVEIVVYEDRALVTREGEVDAPGGVGTIVVGGLPPSLLETSIRAGFVQGSEGRVISVSSEVERRREVQDAKLRAVEERRRAVERRIAELDDDLARIAARDATIEAYEKVAMKAISERTGGGADAEAARWPEALRFIREARNAAAAERREVAARRESVERDRGDLAAEAERLRRPAERSTRNAEVVLETKAPGRIGLRISYVIGDSGWSPRYDARFDEGTGNLAVTAFGEVHQRTGEDWKDARLVLSTARPSVGASRPSLVPLKITLVTVTGGRKGKGIAEVVREPVGALVPDDAAARPGAGEAAGGDLVTAEVKESATAATFTVPGQASVPADGRPHKVPVVVFREKAATSFETAPRLERFVYLKASTRNGSPFPMLAGPVDIYRGSGFIGTSRLDFVAPGRPFEISLGIEESLKVRRAVTHDAATDGGREKRHGFDIEVANFGELPRRVTVIENVPVSDIEEVRVRVDAATTPFAEEDRKEGIVRWKLDVPPGETRQVHLEYTIRYPG